MKIELFQEKLPFALPGQVTTQECACSRRLSASLNGAGMKNDIFASRRTCAARKYFQDNMFGVLNIFILKIHVIRGWLKTLLNQ